MACTMRAPQADLLHRVFGGLVLLSLSSWSGMSSSGALAQTYLLSDGDIVTCIYIEDQPSLKGSGLTYNKFPTTVIADPYPTVFPDSSAHVAVQTFAQEVPSGCPEGTIPITNKTLGLDQAPKALSSKQKRQSHDGADSSDSDSAFPHEYAIGKAYVDPPLYKGTEVVINIWNPEVANGEEFSLAQLWLVSTGNPLNTVEVGYQVYEGLGGDHLSRLFVYWTADDYSKTGCYELGCPGFVQVSPKVLLRGSFQPVSTQEQRYEIKLRVFKDDYTQDWWLQLNDEYVGYWPAQIYPADGLQGAANNLHWGGEIFYDKDLDGNRHTTTDMGSGEEEAAKSAYMRNLKYVDSGNQLVDAPFYVFNTSAPCYEAEIGDTASHPTWGSYFYFGGPGYGPSCLTEPNTV